MMRIAVLAAAMVAATPLAAQDHSAHGKKPAAQPEITLLKDVSA